MKKIISLTLITIMILAATVLPIFAATVTDTEELSREEAILLIQKAVQTFDIVQYSEYDDYNAIDDVKVIEHSEIVKSIPSTIHEGFTDYYFKINWLTELSFSSVDDVKAYLKESFSIELAEKVFLQRNRKVATFIEGDNGELLHHEGSEKQINLFHRIMYKGESDFGEFVITGDKAIMSITLYNFGTESVWYDNGNGNCGWEEVPAYLPSTETVEFTKTADGWRVSGGTAFEVMLGEREATPNTGDTTATTVAILATIALAAVITPFALSKKRRVR